jgi:hypothetical protein
MNNFEDKEFKEVQGGKYDQHGFYYLPDGSFWDPDGVYFNNGLDKHGGYYNEHLEYIPGPGWIDDLMCYEDEKEGVLKNKKSHHGRYKGEEEEDDIFEELDEIIEDRDYAKILREEVAIYEQQKTEDKEIKNTQEVKETISPEQLFNKIPENKKPLEQKETVRKEKVIEVDSLFG